MEKKGSNLYMWDMGSAHISILHEVKRLGANIRRDRVRSLDLGIHPIPLNNKKFRSLLKQKRKGKDRPYMHDKKKRENGGSAKIMLIPTYIKKRSVTNPMCMHAYV